MKTIRLLTALGVTALAVAAHAATYVAPFAHARGKNATFTTAISLRNDGKTLVTCDATLTSPEGELHHAYVLRPGEHTVDDAKLGTTNIIGAARFECTGAAMIATRVHTSENGGQTFDRGRVFPAATPGEQASTTRFAVTRDAVLVELRGEPATVQLTLTGRDGALQKEYHLGPFAQKILDFGEVRERDPDATVVITGSTHVAAITASTSPRVLSAFAPATESGDRPVVIRTNIEHIASFTNAVPAGETRPLTLYEMPSLYLAADTTSKTRLLTGFKAAPFIEPATGLVLFRDRWYDPGTGTFLTPDRIGYKDSANLYAFGGGDPVNRSDPSGTEAGVGQKGNFVIIDPRNGQRQYISSTWARSNGEQLHNLLMDTGGLSYEEAIALEARGGVSWASIRGTGGATLHAVKSRPGTTALSAFMTAANTANGLNNLLAGPMGQDLQPIVTPQTENEWRVKERADDVTNVLLTSAAAADLAAGFTPRPLTTSQRATGLLNGNRGVNITPRLTGVRYRVIIAGGRNGAGTAVTDVQAVESVIGRIADGSRMTITAQQARMLEGELGLTPYSVQNGTTLSLIDDVAARVPRSPLAGNPQFRGRGVGLPGGGPEINIAPINSAGGGGIRQVTLNVQ